MMTPISYPIWKLMVHFGMSQDDPILIKWWQKVTGEGKGDAQNRLFKYIQAISYFNSVSDHFWSQMAINPTYFTTEGIVIRLTAMGDWIRTAALDHYNWADRFYMLAKSVAHDEPKGSAILKTLESAWPAQLKGNTIHYDGNPFAKVDFIVNEGQEQVCISPALKMYKFNADKVWTEASTPPEPSTSKSEDKSKKRKLSNSPLLPESMDPLDSADEDVGPPFAMIANDSEFLLHNF